MEFTQHLEIKISANETYLHRDRLHIKRLKIRVIDLHIVFGAHDRHTYYGLRTQEMEIISRCHAFTQSNPWGFPSRVYSRPWDLNINTPKKIQDPRFISRRVGPSFEVEPWESALEDFLYAWAYLKSWTFRNGERGIMLWCRMCEAKLLVRHLRFSRERVWRAKNFFFSRRDW
jgi:hypothetical protein